MTVGNIEIIVQKDFIARRERQHTYYSTRIRANIQKQKYVMKMAIKVLTFGLCNMLDIVMLQ